MNEMRREHRLEGLEPDNLLAFLALLGLLRALEAAPPQWRPRVRWSLERAPLRPVLLLREGVEEAEIAAAAAEGLAELANGHVFDRADLDHSVEQAREALRAGRGGGEYAAALTSALMSDVAVRMAQGKPLDVVEATPLCLLFGQGHQHFLGRLAAVPRQAAPPARGKGKKAVQITPAGCLAEALFQSWERQDPTFSFRWDPQEAVRYALMSGDPSEGKNKEGTQHGANRLAAVGLSVLPVAPEQRGGQVRLGLPGGAWRHGFRFGWPIWRHPISLQAIRALLVHPDLREPAALERLGVDHVREARRIPLGKFMNFTRATPLEDAEAGPV